MPSRRAISAGRSPRGRGSRQRLALAGGDMGSIPAWAGEPRRRSAAKAGPGVDPRVGGGAANTTPLLILDQGRSPRGRGSLVGALAGLRSAGSIPAWAGEPARSFWSCLPTRVDPRVGGGAITYPRELYSYQGRSPRGRGSPCEAVDMRDGAGSIPAWAGEPFEGQRVACNKMVDPRVGGGAAGAANKRNAAVGRSPRGRGSHTYTCGLGSWKGSIPAWAGEP